MREWICMICKEKFRTTYPKFICIECAWEHEKQRQEMLKEKQNGNI